MAKERKEDPEDQEQPSAPKPKSNFKWVIIIAALVVVVAAAAIGGVLLLKKDSPQHPATPQSVAPAIWPMDAFIINIAETNGERYLKLVIQLEVNDPTVVAELEQIKPKLRDSILDLLTAKTFKELMDLAGKQRLREDIAGRINNILTKGKVTKVYFTDFVVQ